MKISAESKGKGKESDSTITQREKTITDLSLQSLMRMTESRDSHVAGARLTLAAGRLNPQGYAKTLPCHCSNKHLRIAADI